MKVLEEFIDTASVISLDAEVTERTILLRRVYKKLKLGDAIIAASAIVHGLTVVTRNVADFEGVEGLLFINPWTAHK
jgi:predicted nucleic acid-binding protein